MAGSMVDLATSDMLIDPDWALNREICDICNSHPGQSKHAVKALKKRIGHKNPKVQLLALTLLETVIENCGDILHTHVAEADILHEMVKIVKKKSDPHVKEKVLVLIDTWQEAFGGPGARYPQYYAAYHELVRAGAEFPKRLEQSQAARNMRSPDQQDEAESSASNDFPALSMSEIQNARGVMDVLAEMLNALDPGNREGLRQEVIVELVDQCRTSKPRVVQLVNSTTDEELMSQGLALNDDLHRVLAKHDAIAVGIAVPVETEDSANQDSKKEQGLIDIEEPTSQDAAKEPNQRMVLPEPDITIIIEEGSTEPFQYKSNEIRSWLSIHSDEEDILVGEHANKECIPDLDELVLLGPHPLLERQMGKCAPLRWLHLKLQLATNPDCWFRLVLRADTFYMKGFSNRPNHGAPQCFEITEVQYEKRNPNPTRPRLFPLDYNATPLPWDLKYFQLLGFDRNDEDEILRVLRNMLDDPTFMTRATKFFCFYDPNVGDSRVAKRLLAGVTFKLCEFVRMRLTLDSPNLMKKVWHWGDTCLELRMWKENKYDCTQWTEIKGTGIKEPRDGLELVSLVLNKSHGSFVLAKDMEVKRQKRQKAPHSSRKHGKRSGRRRIQILEVLANFAIDGINVHDWHRGQTLYMNTNGHQQSKSLQDKSLMLCGPCRPIGAYGYMRMEIFPTGQEPLNAYWNVSNYMDADTGRFMGEVSVSSEKRVLISYLHLPNAIEAKIKMLLYLDESSDISGFVKATTKAYGKNYVELFMKEKEEKISVSSGEGITLPLLVDVLCLPYRSDVELKIDVDLSVAQRGGRPYRRTRTLRFTKKYGKENMVFDDSTRLEVIVFMTPDPPVTPLQP